MTANDPDLSDHVRWAQFRHSVVGQLLAAPPKRGELRSELEKLAARQWRHPLTGDPVTFGFATIERWAYERPSSGRVISPSWRPEPSRKVTALRMFGA